jgi:hypothetical protein
MLGATEAVVDGKEEPSPENMSVDNGVETGDLKV